MGPAQRDSRLCRCGRRQATIRKGDPKILPLPPAFISSRLVGQRPAQRRRAVALTPLTPHLHSGSSSVPLIHTIWGVSWPSLALTFSG